MLDRNHSAVERECKCAGQIERKHKHFHFEWRLLRNPRLRRDDQRFDTRFERGMNDRSETWIMIRRDLVHAAGGFCFFVNGRISAADEPEYGGCTPVFAART